MINSSAAWMTTKSYYGENKCSFDFGSPPLSCRPEGEPTEWDSSYREQVQTFNRSVHDDYTAHVDSMQAFLDAHNAKFKAYLNNSFMA